MNKFQKAGLAIAFASGIAFAQGSLWQVTEDFPSLQVRVPNVVDCWSTNSPDPDDYSSPCYEKAGGWWFGYVNKQGAEPGEVVKVKIGGTFVNFGTGVALSDGTDGSFLIQDALEVQLSTKSAPSIEGIGAGFGFNHKQESPSNRWDNSPNAYQNISNKPGYCITYTLSGDPMQFVLGWDESQEADGNARWDVFFTPLQPTATKKALDLPFADFSQVGWFAGKWPLTKATEQAVSVKIRYNGEGQEGSIAVYQLGWTGECDTNGGSVNPIVAKAPSSNIAMNLAGRSLSLSGINKAVSVQLISLNGAVVAKQTLQPSGKMNLSNLPTGVYIVRVPSLGYVSKVTLK